MKLQKLILVRHGDYEGEPNTSKEKLNVVGKIKMKNLAGKIKGFLHPVQLIKEVRILHSPTKRAEESARILLCELTTGEIPTVSIQAQPALYSDDDTKPNLKEVADLIDHETTEVLIMVTHAEVMDELPHYINEHATNGGLPLPPRRDMTMDKGGAFFIDCQKKTFQPVFP